MSTKRPVLIHYNIFRNAGEQVEAALKGSFGNTWTTFEGTQSRDAMPAAELQHFLARSHHLRSVSSHLARPPLPWPECRPIVFLSHPIKRARSVFNFVRVDPTQPDSEIARVRGFAGYVRWALEGGDGGVVIRNYQVVHLSAASFRNGSVYRANATDADLAEACSLIDSWGVIGLVDCFDASAQLIQKLYSQIFPDLRLDRYWLDEEEAVRKDESQELTEIRTELGAELFELLESHNALDLKLHGFAKERFAALCSDQGIQTGMSSRFARARPPVTARQNPDCQALPAKQLFFLHIPKTGGIAFSHHLQNQFGAQDVCPAQFWPEFADIPHSTRCQYGLISAHLSFDIWRYLDHQPSYLTMLRHPVERVLSMYDFQRHFVDVFGVEHNRDEITAVQRKARSEVARGLLSFLRSPDESVRLAVSNAQTLLIAGGNPRSMPEPVEQDMLEKAKSNLREFAFIGLTERMQPSLNLLSYSFGWLPRESITLNDTPHRVSRSNLPPDIVELIAEMNRLDLELYRYASQLFEERYALMCGSLKQKFSDGTGTSSATAGSDEGNRIRVWLNRHYEECYAKSQPLQQDVFHSKLDFGPVGVGWYQWEGQRGMGHRWTGPGPVSNLDLSLARSRPLRITWQIARMAAKDILQRVRLRVNGHEIEIKCSVLQGEWHRITGVAPTTVLAIDKPFTRIELILDRTIPARDIIPSTLDDRKVGVAVHSIDVRPAEAAPATLH